MISIAGYYKGRDVAFASELTQTVQANALVTVSRVNELLAAFYAEFPGEAIRTVNSGWRPAAVNADVPNAAAHSHHTTGEACDLSDDDGALDDWLMTADGQSALMRVGLWMEHPSATPRWCHVQIVPPHSGSRVFFP